MRHRGRVGGYCVHEGKGRIVFIGADIGSRFLKVVQVDGDGHVCRHHYGRHGGKPVDAFEESVAALGLAGDCPVGITGALGTDLAARLGLPVIDTLRATIAGVRTRMPAAANIIDAGGSSITLIELDGNGKLSNYSTNSVCAAGTGSFLDAQAVRLGLDFDDLPDLDPVLEPPTIAARCAVFAKSDLIHRQQEGFDRDALWAGLCRGLASQLLQTLLQGRRLNGPTVVVGGVAKNAEVVGWLDRLQRAEVGTYEGAELAAATGAALIAAEEDYQTDARLDAVPDATMQTRTKKLRPPLRLEKSRYPSFAVEEAWTDDSGNEVRVTRIPTGPTMPVFMGLDVGSTSTKVVLTDPRGEVILDVYRRTDGDPIGATKKLFLALLAIERKYGIPIEVLGCGTTGSGRKLVGTVTGADAVVNEISAHVAGALATDPEVDTIFEIGGQDSKYIRMSDGIVRDVNMNYVCAAGTGSFVEEQAHKLGYGVEEIGPLVMDISPPHTSDRCTVFMEQDLEALLREGYTPAEGLAGVLYSVVQNYLAKVVGARGYSREKIFYCGATARNQGLVAAFEQLIGAEIVVSPYCHVTGAWGVALLAAQRLAARSERTRFRGLDLSDREVSLTQEVCDICENYCRITYAHIEGETEVPSWGYLCGRDPEDEEKRDPVEFEPVLERERLVNRAIARHRVKPQPGSPIVGLPRSLSTFSHRALWQSLLGHLGVRVLLSTPTDRALIERSQSLIGAEYCLPEMVAHGHVADLLEKDNVDWVFVPHLVSDVVPEEHSNAFFCPLVSAGASPVRASLAVRGEPGIDRLLKPIVDFRWSLKRQVSELLEVLGEPLGVSRSRVARAWQEALATQREFEESVRITGARLLAELREEGRPIVLIAGRPYNLFDGGANLELPLKIADHGYSVFPMDFVPFDEVELGPEFYNLYWTYGQKLMKALIWARDQPDVYPIWFTNFKCGPDSFLLTYGEHVLGDKPALILELDSHGGDAGYLTRVEAFLDVMEIGRPVQESAPKLPYREDPAEEIARRHVWVTHMNPFSTPFAAATLRAAGYDASPLPEEDEETLAVGRSVTRGGECLPMVVTVGRTLQTLRDIDGDGSDQALFIPSACGPCRFGQYRVADQLIMTKAGYGGLAFLSPNNDNAYQGLGDRLRLDIFGCIVAGDIFFKIGTRYRPYETVPGQLDGMLEAAKKHLLADIEFGIPLEESLDEALRPFRSLEKPESTKPLVGVVGEIFVRCNPFANDYVVRAIESYGGEAWMAPFHEWVLYAAWEHGRRAREGWDLLGQAKSYLKNRVLFEREERMYEVAGALLEDRHEPSIDAMAELALPYAPYNFAGETLVTIGRAIEFFASGAQLVVNCAPFGCVAGSIVTGLMNEVQKDYGKPVMSMYYDGTGDLNRRIGVFLKNLGPARSAAAGGNGVPLPMVSG